MHPDHDHDHDHDHPRGEPAPEAVLEASNACLDYVKRAIGVSLDFTPETLSVLDHYVGLVRPDIKDRPELVPLIARAVGAYFGEVVRAVVPSFWRLPSPNVLDWQLCAKVAFFWFNPLGVAYDALYQSVEHDGPRSLFRVAPEDKDVLSGRLAVMPEVPEDEYYLFTTRIEVVEASVEALRARLEAKGYGESEFTEEDYVQEMMLS